MLANTANAANKNPSIVLLIDATVPPNAIAVAASGNVGISDQ